MARQIIFRMPIELKLTERELQCCGLYLLADHTAKLTAERMQISKWTVQEYRRLGMDKCGTRDHFEMLQAINKKSQFSKMVNLMSPYLTEKFKFMVNCRIRTFNRKIS